MPDLLDAPAPRPIRFYHRGRVVEVGDAAPTRTVLDWLREDARCVGTKEGCNEGDCGACTVVIGAPAEAGDPMAVRGLALQTVNACIRFLPTLDGRALYTVEDLKRIAAPATGGPASAALHPVQQAMVDCHGSQCGFCTPGFVMSLWSAYERCAAAGARPTRQQLADELSGNLCRCTGYRPILDAGQRMFELPPVALDTAPVLEALRRLAGDADLHHRPPARPAGTDGGDRSPPATAIVAKGVFVGNPASASAREPTSAVAAGRARFDAPTTLDALAALRLAKPDATLLAGATDIGLWVTKQFRPLGDILYLGRVDELKRISTTAGELHIGAGASLEAAFAALVARRPELTDAWLRFASPPIRNAGTLGGNIANGSPIGDSAPILMALDAAVVLRRGDAVRRLPLDGFYVDYMKNRMEPGEFVQGLAIPLDAFERQVRGYKISKRFDSDISAVFGGFAIAFEGAGESNVSGAGGAGGAGGVSAAGAAGAAGAVSGVSGVSGTGSVVDASARGAGATPVVHTIRLAFGGMAATTRRAARAEAAILGQPWNEAAVAAAQAALAEDFKPLSDMRASAAYRLQVAQNLVRRLWFETRAVDPLAASATSVYAGMPHRALGPAVA